MERVKTLQEQLRAVHNKLTALMAEPRLSSRARQALRQTANELFSISQQFEAAIASEERPDSSVMLPSAEDERQLVERVIDFLAKLGSLIMCQLWDTDGS